MTTTETRNVDAIVNNLTPDSRKLLDEFVDEAPDWDGQPCLKELTPQEKGNLSDLVKKNLVEVIEDDMGEGSFPRYVSWVKFPKDVASHFELEEGYL